jgi:phosphopantetheinyl transferase
VYAINTISPIGVDIEPIKRKLNDVVNIDNMKRWTIKEAVIKTLGARSIKDVNNVSIISDSVAIFNNRKYNYKVLKLYGHFITICVTDNIK